MFSAWHQRPLVKLGKLFRIYRKIWEDMGNHELIPQKNIACFFCKSWNIYLGWFRRENLQETSVLLVKYTGFPANVPFNQVVD